MKIRNYERNPYTFPGKFGFHKDNCFVSNKLLLPRGGNRSDPSSDWLAASSPLHYIRQTSTINVAASKKLFLKGVPYSG